MPKAAPALDFKAALLSTYQTNERLNQYLLENLSVEAWGAPPPGGKGRPIAAIVAHLHNVRVMWLSSQAKAGPVKIPEKLDRDDCTRAQAAEALRESADAVADAITTALTRPDGKVRDFRPDVVHFIAYLISHDAHHRGQITMLARQVGHPIPKTANFGLWEWGKRTEEGAG